MSDNKREYSRGESTVKAGKETVVYGYARVSSVDQNLSRQLDALIAAGVEGNLVFADKASGKDFKRPEWRKLMNKIKKGDTLIVKSIDRLGRNYNEIIDQWRNITNVIEANIVVLDMPLLDTRCERGDITGTFIADLVLQILSYVAQVERENIKTRQAEGIEAAKARGVHMGRPRKKRPRSYLSTKQSYLEGHITRAEAAAILNCGVTTFDKWLREDALESKDAEAI